MIALTISLFFRRESFSFIVTRLHRHKTMPKPKVWVHATQEEIFNKGWRTEFREMATQHFDIITAQGMNATFSLPNISGERFSITHPQLSFVLFRQQCG